MTVTSCRYTYRIGRPGLAHLLINFIPNRHSGIAPLKPLTAPKFSPALKILFNWLPFWLLLSVIAETGCLRCIVRPQTRQGSQGAVGLRVGLDFDLSTSKWSHGSPVSRASFLPIFSFLCPSILDLRSGTVQTDGQTDNGHPRLM